MHQLCKVILRIVWSEVSVAQVDRPVLDVQKERMLIKLIWSEGQLRSGEFESCSDPTSVQAGPCELFCFPTFGPDCLFQKSDHGLLGKFRGKAPIINLPAPAIVVQPFLIGRAVPENIPVERDYPRSISRVVRAIGKQIRRADLRFWLGGKRSAKRPSVVIRSVG